MVNSKSYICSRHNQIFLLIVQYLHCSISFINSNVNYGGRPLKNGSWNGILSLFDRKQADFVPHVFSINNKRNLIINFKTLLPAKEHITILSYPQVVINENPWNIFSSFSFQIWILIGLFFLFYGTLNWVDLLKICKEKYYNVSSFLGF